MSPRLSPSLPSAGAVRTVGRVALTVGLTIRDTRIRRAWTMTDLARRAGVSVAAVHHVEAGRAASLEMYARLASALGLRFDASMLDPRRPTAGGGGDPVHAAMGELQVDALRARGFRVAIDEPYQHYQFAGRADVVAWDADARALLHLENRTRFPNLQDAAGAFNAKRAYLGAALAERMGLRPWRSETHVLVVAWTAEAIRDLRRSEASIRAICPDAATGFEAWWRGEPVADGRRSEIVVLDPVPAATLGKRRRWVDLERAFAATPRHKGYATLADDLRATERGGQAGIGASR